MLEQLSEQVRECLSFAADAKARADETCDPKLKRSLLDMERRWLKLARSVSFSESIGAFTAAVEDAARGSDGLRAQGYKTNPTPLDDPRQLRWLASIVESSDDAIVSKDLDGTIISWNKGAERLFGYAAEEAIGKAVTMLIPIDRRDEEPRILERIRQGERIDHYETVRQRKDGSLIEISLCVSPVRDERGVVIGASKIARDISQRNEMERHAAVLAREAEHRARNILSTVSATIELSQSDTPEGLKAAIRGRIQALANVHALFVESRWAGAELTQVVAQELSPYQSERRVLIDGPKLVLEPSLAQAVAVTVHELATNAAKYGALATPGGTVRIVWSLADDHALAISWTERGGPAVAPPIRRGFGSRVMNTLIQQLGGEITFDWQVDGLACTMSLPQKKS